MKDSETKQNEKDTKRLYGSRTTLLNKKTLNQFIELVNRNYDKMDKRIERLEKDSHLHSYEKEKSE